MAESNKKGMISGLDSLLTIGGEEFLEVIRLESDGTYKNYRLLVSKIRNNAGLSAYEIAVQNGFVGTAEDWLDSLNGKSVYDIAVELGFVGDEAAFVASMKGDEGEVGKSIYEVALENGFIGTEADFLKTLQGKSAYQSAVDQGFVGTEAQWLLTVKGPQGNIGPEGKIGPDGKSAFQVWQAQAGNAGKTEAQYMAAIKGATGKSAYESAVDKGFVGTEVQWLATLEGKSAFQTWQGQGNSGNEADFLATLKGAEGRSAYQVWADQPANAGKTEAQYLASLKGTPGIDGTNGTNGRSAYQSAVAAGFVGTEAQWLASLKGAEGKLGQGINIIATVDSAQFDEIVDQDESNPGDAYIVGVYLYAFNSDRQWIRSNSMEGPAGRGLNYLGEWPTGTVLPLGAAYKAGDTYVWRNSLWTLSEQPTRRWVDIGVPGPEGKSAYQSWLEQPGNAGKTEAEFIAAYRGLPGRDGQDGEQGIDGESAYQVARRNGFVGTEAQWVASLTGEEGPQGEPALAFEIKGELTNVNQLPRPGKPTEAYYVNRELYIWIVDSVTPANSDYKNFGSLNGASAYEIAVEAGYTGTEAQWLASLKGTNGTNGVDGRNLNVLGTKVNLAAIQAIVDPKDQDAWVAADTGKLHIRVGATWLDAGQFRGTNGTNGVDGRSAYQVAVANGYVGTEAAWVGSLQGRNVEIKGSVANQAALPANAVAQDAYTTQDTSTLFMWINNAWVNLGKFHGDTGPRGLVGPEGKRGIGVSIKGEVERRIDLPTPSTQDEGSAWFVQEDGLLYQVNELKVYGPGINIRGLTGEIGADGPQGPAGTSITIMGSYGTESALIAAHPTGVNGQGYLIGDNLYLYGVDPATGGAAAWYNAGPVRGPQGIQGIQGKTGLKGNTGDTGPRGSLWLTLPTGVLEPTPDYGRPGDWAVNPDYDTFYNNETLGWVHMGKLVAGDVNSPLASLGKVIRQGNQWVALPVDEVPVFVAGKYYVRRLKSGETTKGEWVEIVTIADLAANQKDDKNYVRVFEAAGTAPIWKELVIPVNEAPTTAGKTYLRSGQNANWVEYTGISEAPNTAGKTYLRSGQNANWVEFTGTPEAPNDGRSYTRRSNGWVAFDRYDVSVTTAATGNTATTVDPTLTQFLTVDNSSGSKTITLSSGPVNRAMTLVVYIVGSGGTLTFAAGGGSTLAWNGGVQPAITGVRTILTFLWTGGATAAASFWIGAPGAVVP